MKKSILISIYAILAITVLSSCNPFHRRVKGHGNSITVSSNIDVEGISKIEANSAIDVEVIYSDISYADITAQENIIDIISLKVKGNTLIVGTKPNISFKATDVAKVTVYIPEITSVSTNGSGDIETIGNFISNSDIDIIINGSGDIKTQRIECSDLYICVNGSGDIKSENLKSDVTQIEIEGSGETKIDNLETSSISTLINGSGDIKYSGTAYDHSIKINGSGNINAYNLNTEKAKVTVNGSGDSYIHVKENLNVVIRGSGDVFYRGNPRLNIDSNGSGKVTSR